MHDARQKRSRFKVLVDLLNVCCGLSLPRQAIPMRT